MFKTTMPQAAKGAKHGKKRRLTVTVSESLYEWAEARTGEGGEFGSMSHAVERGLALLKEHVEGKSKK